MKIALSPREYIFLLLLIATPAAMWYMVFKPQSELTNLLVEEMADMSDKLGRYEDVRQLAVDTVEDDIEQLDKALEIMNARLPDDDQVAQVLQELNAMARKNNLAVVLLTPTKRENDLTKALESRFGAQWFKVNLQGNFMDFYKFMQDLESQTERVLRVNEILVFATRGANFEPGTVNAELEIITFYRRPPATKEEPKKPADAIPERSA